jgi:hypothetical protein
VRLLICGSRRYRNRSKIRELLEQYRPAVLICGMAPGADRIAYEIAKKLGILVEEYPADWAAQGKAAGPIRNQQMLREGKPDRVVALPVGSLVMDSRGTWDMVRRARAAGVPVDIVEESG